jgi:radical SAM superfamily enzyme YgiQ (UPF0313 family)
VRLLLINTNRAREPFPVPPLGLACLAAAARRAGHQVRLLDLAFGEWRRRLSAALAGFRPEAVGLGVRNIDTALREHYRSYLPEVREVARLVRRPHYPLILGGSGFSIFPRLLLGCLGGDYGLTGEAEESLPLLLERLAAGRDPSDVPGLVWRAGGTTRMNPPTPCQDLAALPEPAHGLIDYAAYEAEAGFAAVQTKRGCPAGCIYCNYPLLEGRRVRLRPAEAVAEELAGLERTGVRHVFFADAVFNLPTNHAAALCEEMLRRGLRLRWMAYANPKGLDPALARLFARSGCLGLELGIDSASDRMLAALGKGFTQAEVVRASAALSAAAVPQALYCLLGGPGESEATGRESLSVIARHTRPEFVAVNVGLRVFPGTPLADQLGWRDGGLSPRFYVSPELNPAALGRLLALCRRHTRFATPRDLDHPLSRALLRLMVRLRVRPFWRHAWLNGWARRLCFWEGP